MKDRITAAEYLEYLESGKIQDEKPSKYRNKKTEYDGMVYDSKHEAKRAWELDQLQKAGEIAGYSKQVPFLLAGGIIYKADFVVFYHDGHYEIEDSKGMRTDTYKLKKKLMAEKGLIIKEV